MKADLHIHTNLSYDGVSTPEQVLEMALERGMGCIAITDHNTVEAYDLVKGNGRVIVIPGVEVSSAEGHILAYGISVDIPRDLPVKETIDLIHDAGGVAFAAHPYRWWSGLGEANVVNNGFDGIEALNSRSVKRDNMRSRRLAEGSGKPISAGSDAHVPEHVGDGYVELPDDISCWEDALRAVMEGRAVPFSKDRRAAGTIKYGIKSIVQWIFRGFKRM